MDYPVTVRRGQRLEQHLTYAAYLIRRKGTEPLDPILEVLQQGGKHQDDLVIPVHHIQKGNDPAVGQPAEYLDLPTQTLARHFHLRRRPGQPDSLGGHPPAVAVDRQLDDCGATAAEHTHDVVFHSPRL
jgi:hypothetical protein